jgi:UDP-N-acetylglucosamine 1-carboxyvinyltransferase
MAATAAKGETIIENAAREPEVVDLARMLKKMGARIEGEGTEVVRVKGVKELTPCSYDVIPERKETGTFLAACGITRGSIIVDGCIPEHVETVISKLREAGMEIICDGNTIKAAMTKKKPLSVDVKTTPHPGFPTDMQAQIMALMSTAKGISAITETIFENRMMHAAELRRMGADIRVIGNTAIVKGVETLSGAKVMATDLRASASLIMAGLAAYGTTEISRIYHIDRGYEQIEEKLKKLGQKSPGGKMRIWDLENEYGKFISFVLKSREKKKKNVRSAVETIKSGILERKERALKEFSQSGTGGIGSIPSNSRNGSSAKAPR